MDGNDKNVLIVGGGVAGLSAAVELARLGIGVELVEKADEPGGYAGQFTCKAVDKCARCGACIVEEKIKVASASPKVKIHTGVQLDEIKKSDRFFADIIDKIGSRFSLTADAVIIASGFSAFDPESKPYGYRMFDNVITNLELERMLRQEGTIRRPSDNKVPDKIAFIQCVGSRDGKLNHLWCSKVCCGSALRMAKLIKSRQAEVEATFFYMDVQTFGKDFQAFYSEVRHDVNMVRAIPGDIYRTEDDRLMVSYFKAGENETTEGIFDMVILSVGITPGKDNGVLAEALNVKLDASGFFSDSGDRGNEGHSGVFYAGTAIGPMSIADSLADAGRAVKKVLEYLEADRESQF